MVIWVYSGQHEVFKRVERAGVKSKANFGHKDSYLCCPTISLILTMTYYE